MISRRHIRVKVMQTLYTLAASGEMELSVRLKKGQQVLAHQLDELMDHFAGALLLTIRLAQHAEVDATRRRSKHLPTPEDLVVPTRIAGNTFLWSLLESPTFQQRIKDSGLDKFVTDDFIKTGHKALQQLPEYAAYNEETERHPKAEKAMFQVIWEKLIAGSDWGREFLNDSFSGWEDDAEVMAMLLENFFRKPGKTSFAELLTEEKRQYAKDLVKYCIDKAEYLDETIQPRLKNWDPERVAQIDFILLRMGVCELLYFPTIPTKVTINEYIDIAKTYSTAQSGQFVNGVLDNLLKDLTAKDLIRKQDRLKKA
ncbi:MAG: transcription antitermination factor NusB [Sphingobacteriales bacterium]|nr:MAG: transcription antitermination factor NusB [Sphingobacteriales bacterium]